MKPNAKGKTAYDLVTDVEAKAALRSRPFIFLLSHSPRRATLLAQSYNPTTVQGPLITDGRNSNEMFIYPMGLL